MELKEVPIKVLLKEYFVFVTLGAVGAISKYYILSNILS